MSPQPALTQLTTLENSAKASVSGDGFPWAAGLAVSVDSRLAMSKNH